MKMVKHKRILCLVLAALFIFTVPVYSAENKSQRFSDVPEGHWADKFIHELRSLGITDGIGNNRFGMGLTIKKCEFIAFLSKLLKWELVTPEKGSFTDNTDPGKWYYPYIETALNKGVILKESERFGAEEPITREEMAVMIVRALGFDALAGQLGYLGRPFDDVFSSAGYITIAKDFGIITGVGGNRFNPYATAKREEAAAMMIRMYNRLSMPVRSLHAFYAISSSSQAKMIQSLDSVGFGWSRLEYDTEKDRVVLNTTSSNNNEYAFPDGFEQPLSLAEGSGASALLMVFAGNDTVISTKDGSNHRLLEYLLSNQELRRQAVGSIVKEISTVNASFDGVVIDFENMKGSSLKDLFNIFLSELKQELEKSGKLLYVAVHPAARPGQPFFDAYDFRAIGETADKVILMAHDYYAKQLTDAEMQSGYTATPVTPIADVYYALASITDKETGVRDLNKVMLQISFDSAQWKLKDGRVLNRYPYNPGYDAIYKRLAMEGVEIKFSEPSQNPYATFYSSEDGTYNVLWYEDSRSVDAKIRLAKMFGINGISLWRLGNIPDYEDPGAKKVYLDVWKQILKYR